ncbi:hypothetical protein DL96DRAFT_1621520 [Flagelloscypha sp. PMI_526]|nr:hypothetical protein DL96DRAFT_1621520 [Flagelloscypha sp. PMI_526]
MDSLNSVFLQEEWETFSSIYPDFVTSPLSKDRSLKLEIPVNLEASHSITVKQEGICKSKSSPIALSASVLPPIVLHILFPSGYPYTEHPIIQLFSSAGSWVPNQNIARDWLIDQWVMGEPVLDRWTTAIYSGDMLQELGLLDRLSLEICITHHTPQALASCLQEFDNTEKHRIFAESSFFCELCLSDVHGRQCLQLVCQHIFCRDCLKDFWSLHISEGQVERVTCPDPGCVKDKRSVVEDDIARIVSPDELDRLKGLRKKAALEKDPTVVHCPVCQLPVIRPQESVNGRFGWRNLRSCDSCGYNFCAYCRRTWHGPLYNCREPQSVVTKDLGQSTESKPGTLPADRNGSSNRKRRVKAYKQEQESAKRIKETTTQCPQCTVAIEKSEGCNHMVCSRCHTHFCFACGGRLFPLSSHVCQ